MTEIRNEQLKKNAETIRRFFPIIMLFFAVFIPVEFILLKDPVTGWSLSVCCLLVIILIPICLKKNWIMLASNFLPFAGMCAILPWIISGGPGGTGLWWSIVYVVGVFAVTTKRSAFFWLALYLLIGIIITLLSVKGILKVAYTMPELLNLMFAYVCTFAYVYSFIESREHYQKLANEKEKELMRMNAEQRFRLVVESDPNAIILVNIEGIITLVNRQTETLFGYNRDELIGNKVEMLLPARYREHHPDLRKMFFEKPSTRAMGSGRDLFAAHRNGTEIPVEIGLNPLESSEGQIVLASIIDITERKKQQQTIQDQLTELELKNRELEQFTYIASHDLQEPLLTVSNYIEILEEDYEEKLDPQARSHMKTISNAALRMRTLVKALLDYSRLGRSRKVEKVDCGKIIREALSDLDNTIKKKNALIELSSRLPVVSGFETELRQLFQNLISNALKFVAKDVAPHIMIDCRAEKSGWLFTVKDNGIGVEQKDFERIFHIFQRLDLSKEHDGHGIGLANCKKIVELHKGKIWLESQPGKGSTFYFTIADIV